MRETNFWKKVFKRIDDVTITLASWIRRPFSIPTSLAFYALMTTPQVVSEQLSAPFFNIYAYYIGIMVDEYPHMSCVIHLVSQ